MKLSPAAEIAIRGVLVLAERTGQGPVSLDVICAQRELPKQYLVKIFSSLARADLITPVRGKHGGYLLARDPGQITLLDVIEAVEGPLALNLCQHSPPKCDREDCNLRGLWSELQGFVRQKLSSMTLARCVQTAKAAAGKPRS
jgi:Rrf2 family protein